jgi:hypothetical protein
VNLKVWLHSIISAAIGGAVSAVSAVLVAPHDFNFSHAGFLSIEKVALSGAIIAVLAVLKQSPLPSNTSQSK